MNHSLLKAKTIRDLIRNLRVLDRGRMSRLVVAPTADFLLLSFSEFITDNFGGPS
jgi:hypothetical protein